MTNMTGDIDVSGTISAPAIRIGRRGTGFRRRLWFLLTCVPRYLFTGVVDIP